MLNLLRKLWHSATGPVAPIRRPTGMSRRCFLRSMGVTTATVALGGMSGSLWQPERKLQLATGPRPLGQPRWIGKSFILEDTVMHVPRESYMLEFFAEELPGQAVLDTKALNEALFEQLAMTPPSQAAVDAVNGFTRMKMQEDGFLRKMLPPPYPGQPVMSSPRVALEIFEKQQAAYQQRMLQEVLPKLLEPIAKEHGWEVPQIAFAKKNSLVSAQA